MQIVILAVGKLKERYFREAEAEYKKRLQAFASLFLEEVTDEPGGQTARVKATEGTRLLDRIKDRDVVIALDARGKKFTSEAFAEHLDGLFTSGASRYVLVIGGSHGLDERVLARADLLLSFSDFTFPHQLMRVILLEQLYRAFQIMRGSPYHK